MTFKINDRVEWKYPEPGADPAEMHGKVTRIDSVITVRFDNGSEETVDESDIQKEAVV